jgi:hypothetical protein
VSVVDSPDFRQFYPPAGQKLSRPPWRRRKLGAIMRYQSVGCQPSATADLSTYQMIRLIFGLSVVDFVTPKAPNFSKIQSSSTSEPQTLQQESLRINKIPWTSTKLVTWFGTRRPVVQIHSPRPFMEGTQHADRG